MRFSYSYRKLLPNLLLSILWISTAIIYSIYHSTISIYGVLIFMIGIVFLLLFIYDILNKYIEIMDDAVIIYHVPKKRIPLQEILTVQNDESHLLIITEKKIYKIYKYLVKPSQLNHLEIVLSEMATTRLKSFRKFTL